MTIRLPRLPPALHYPLYRAYWLGTLASVTGFQIVRFGQFWSMYQRTESPWHASRGSRRKCHGEAARPERAAD